MPFKTNAFCDLGIHRNFQRLLFNYCLLLFVMRQAKFAVVIGCPIHSVCPTTAVFRLMECTSPCCAVGGTPIPQSQGCENGKWGQHLGQVGLSVVKGVRMRNILPPREYLTHLQYLGT